MQVNVDLVQLAATILVSGTGAWIAGKLGVRRALEQTRGQRAFDRQLDWYESAIRVAMRFVTLNQSMAIGVKHDDREIMKAAIESSNALMPELQQKINESMVFSDRETYLLVKQLFADIHRITGVTTALLKRHESERIAQQYDNIAKLAERIAFELAKSVRKHLGLEEITQADFNA
jgi:hypothetical protein